MPEPHDPYALWRNPPDSNGPPEAPPANDQPPPPAGDPPPSDGPIVPDELPPPVVDVAPPDIDVGLPDVGVPDINIGIPDIGVPGIELGLPGASDGIGVGVNAGGDGIGGLLVGDGDGLSLLNLNDDGDTDAIIDLGLPIGSEGSAEVGGDGGHINLGSDGSLLDVVGAADVGSLLNAAMLDVGGTGAMDALALGDAYDGNLPLVGDLSAALGATLDSLTTATSLFDVPVLDVLSLDGLDS